jgi:hypothetical protein
MRLLGSQLCPRDLIPPLASFLHLFAVLRRGKSMTSWSEMLGDGTIRGEKALGVARRLKPLHAPFPLAGGLVGVLCAVVEVVVLAMLDPREDLALRGAVAFELVRNDHPWYIGQTLEQLAKECLRRLFVPAALDENIEDVAVLVHGPPEIVPFPIDSQKYLVQMLPVARTGTLPPEGIGRLLAELVAPLADGFVGHEDPPAEQQLLDIAVAEAEAVV